MSIGERVMELGYDFIWMRFSRPYYITPDGDKITLVVINNCPYLVDDTRLDETGKVPAAPSALPTTEPAPVSGGTATPPVAELDVDEKYIKVVGTAGHISKGVKIGSFYYQRVEHLNERSALETESEIARNK